MNEMKNLKNVNHIKNKFNDVHPKFFDDLDFENINNININDI